MLKSEFFYFCSHEIQNGDKMNNKPIAVVDSGVGGLVTLGAIREAMPGEDIIFLGDTADMPFGTKSNGEICEIAKKITNYLYNERGVKMIILACGTLSSVAVEEIYKIAPLALVQGTIEPAITATARACKEENRIAVLATPAAINSGSHKMLFERLKKKLTLFYRGCPKLASLIEDGKVETPEMDAAITEYLDDLVKEEHVDSVLLGCTHYPLATEVINRLYPELKVIDPAEMLAKNCSMMLRLHELESENEEGGSLTLLTTKKTENLVRMADALGFGDLPIEEVAL